MDADDPLDFEIEDDLLTTTPPLAAKRRKVIGLDDLLSEFYTERTKQVRNEPKKFAKLDEINSGDEDDKTQNNRERMLSKLVDNCQKQVNEMVTEDEIPLWGQEVFGNQKPPPSSNITGLENCKLLQSLTHNELCKNLDLNNKQGEKFLGGLLTNGWLSKMAFICGFVDDPIASWTFHTMLYSSIEELQVSACEFWCDILVPKYEADQPSVRLGWLPSYSQLKEALEAYGYLTDDFNDCSSAPNSADEGGCEGPPQNIRSWVRVVSACCQIRKIPSIFSTSEAADFLVVIIRLLLDRQLLGLSYALHECMQSIINFFYDNEWNASYKKIAHSVAYRIPQDLNCLRTVECISGHGTRSKHLRSQVALEILTICFDQRASDASLILELLTTINVKEQGCDFFKLFIYLVLAENMLVSYPSGEERSTVINMWHNYLRNCSTQITSTDWRLYASKVRNKASYLLQNSARRSCE